MKENQILREFTKLLKNNNAYTQYRTNLTICNSYRLTVGNYLTAFKKFMRIRYKPYSEKNLIENLINYAFSWDCTPQGFHFWKQLDKKWRDILNE